MRCAVACDHAGFPYKQAVIDHLRARGIEVVDFGTDHADSSDYPDYAGPAARAIAAGEVERGVFMCGTGIGVSITANKVPGIRSALVYTPEVAALAGSHNQAQVICFGVRFVSLDTALAMIDAWLDTEALHGDRHQRRLNKITAYEQGTC